MGSNRNKKRREPGIWFPNRLLLDPVFIKLPSRAKALLFDLGLQYNGHNNGSFMISDEFMRENRGWSSKATLHRAKMDLLQAELIVETWKGGLGFGPSFYGFTWLAIDHSTKCPRISGVGHTYRPLK